MTTPAPASAAPAPIQAEPVSACEEQGLAPEGDDWSASGIGAGFQARVPGPFP